MLIFIKTGVYTLKQNIYSDAQELVQAKSGYAPLMKTAFEIENLERITEKYTRNEIEYRFFERIS
jgi:hypothetical protein